MSLPKQKIYSRISSSIKKSLILTLITLLTVATVPPQQTNAATQDCSDVFTPLSASIVNGVSANKAFYLQAMNETGVPWEMLAAIHYRETNFSHTNPSNGQGIFQFVNGEGGPYPAGPVNDTEFFRQLKFVAQKLQNDYVNRGSVPRERRKLQPGETNMALVKDTLFSYNGRASVYATQAAKYGFNSTNQPYEGSPYVMNRFDCQRARMGIITQDYGSMDGIDTRYGTFTVFARLRGDSYWRSLLPFYTEEINMSDAQRRIQTLQFNSQIYTFYYDGLQQVLRMATQDPTNGWQFTILDGTETGGNGRIYGNLGGSLSATVFQGKMHLFYYDKTNGNLRHAWSPNGTSWSFENLDGDRGSVTPREGTVGLFTAIAAYGDSLQVFYYDQLQDNLRHAWASTQQGWRFEDFDGDRNTAISRTDGDFGLSPSIAQFGDSIQLFYYDRTHSDVRHAWANSQHGWRFEDLDGDGLSISKKGADVGITSTVTADNSGLQMYYYDKLERNLRTAWTTPNGWEFANLDGDHGSFGGEEADTGIHAGTTLFFGSQQVYYYNRTTGALRHAWTDETGWRFEDLGPTVIY